MAIQKYSNSLLYLCQLNLHPQELDAIWIHHNTDVFQNIEAMYRFIILQSDGKLNVLNPIGDVVFPFVYWRFSHLTFKNSYLT